MPCCTSVELARSPHVGRFPANACGTFHRGRHVSSGTPAKRYLGNYKELRVAESFFLLRLLSPFQLRGALSFLPLSQFCTAPGCSEAAPAAGSTAWHRRLRLTPGLIKSVICFIIIRGSVFFLGGAEDFGHYSLLSPPVTT